MERKRSVIFSATNTPGFHITFSWFIECTVSLVFYYTVNTYYLCPNSNKLYVMSPIYVVTLLWSRVVSTPFAYIVWLKGYFHLYPLSVGILSTLILHYHEIFIFFCCHLVAFIDFNTHLYEVIRQQLSYILLYNTQHLFNQIQDLRDQMLSVVYISTAQGVSLIYGLPWSTPNTY